MRYGWLTCIVITLEEGSIFELCMNSNDKTPTQHNNINLIANRDRDTQGLVLCEAKTECNEPEVARAEGIA